MSGARQSFQCGRCRSALTALGDTGLCTFCLDETLRSAATILLRDGKLENHGHRTRESRCAECKIVNELLDAAGMNE